MEKRGRILLGVTDRLTEGYKKVIKEYIIRLKRFLDEFICGKRNRSITTIECGKARYEIVTGMAHVIALYALFDWYYWVHHKNERITR